MMNTNTMLTRCPGRQACMMRLGNLPAGVHLPITLPRLPRCWAASNQHGAVQGTNSPVAAPQEPTTTLPQSHSTVRHHQPEDAPASSRNAFLASFSLFLLTNAPAVSAQTFEPVNPFTGVYAPGQYVTFALFLMTVPGIWSQIKRAPKASKKRKVYEVDGPAKESAIPLKERARQVVAYFKKYNYETKEMGEVITFVGTYGASKGQAAALTFYTFVGMASVALVMSLVVPQIGNWWYALTLFAPGAWFYYLSRGTRQEEVKVKMATADDELTTDIIIEGDPEEIDRFRKELDLMEKGMIPVKGLFE